MRLGNNTYPYKCPKGSHVPSNIVQQHLHNFIFKVQNFLLPHVMTVLSFCCLARLRGVQA